jgi:hypothetical protein
MSSLPWGRGSYGLLFSVPSLSPLTRPSAAPWRPHLTQTDIVPDGLRGAS